MALLRPGLKLVTLMMVMRLIIKSIASMTPIAKPVVIPGMVPIVVVVISSPILVVKFASESIVVVAIIIRVDVAVPPVAVVVECTGATDPIHHLMVLIALEWILLLLLLHSVSLLIATVLEVCLYLLRPTSIHFGVAIVFQLTLPVLSPLIRQFPVHVRLLTIPATDWSSVATM